MLKRWGLRHPKFGFYVKFWWKIPIFQLWYIFARVKVYFAWTTFCNKIYVVRDSTYTFLFYQKLHLWCDVEFEKIDIFVNNAIWWNWWICKKIGICSAHTWHTSTYNLQEWLDLPREVPSITESILKKMCDNEKWGLQGSQVGVEIQIC